MAIIITGTPIRQRKGDAYKKKRPEGRSLMTRRVICCLLYTSIPRDEQKCIPACHTFYMSYDKNVKRMASMHICLHTSLHGYFFIKLQLHFHTTMNQYVNKSILQRIIEASKKRPFSTKGISPSIELQDNVCFLFCSVQSLDDGITKLCRTIRV